MGDTHRYCLSCQEVTIWHKSWGFNHSCCRKCGHPSLWAVQGEPTPGRIAERRAELRYMMGGKMPSYV